MQTAFPASVLGRIGGGALLGIYQGRSELEEEKASLAGRLCGYREELGNNRVENSAAWEEEEISRHQVLVGFTEYSVMIFTSCAWFLSWS